MPGGPHSGCWRGGCEQGGPPSPWEGSHVGLRSSEPQSVTPPRNYPPRHRGQKSTFVCVCVCVCVCVYFFKVLNESQRN